MQVCYDLQNKKYKSLVIKMSLFYKICSKPHLFYTDKFSLIIITFIFKNYLNWAWIGKRLVVLHTEIQDHILFIYCKSLVTQSTSSTFRVLCVMVYIYLRLLLHCLEKKRGVWIQWIAGLFIYPHGTSIRSCFTFRKSLPFESKFRNMQRPLALWTYTEDSTE